MTDDNIVSSEAEELILVDDDDRETGYMSKAICHDGPGLTHRAFSLFLFDGDGRLLLQRRARGKRLWPGYWSNSCCSHPRRGESMEVATGRRLLDELDCHATIEFAYKFRYEARYGNEGSENELCHVFLGRPEGAVRPNPTEIAGIRYVTRQALERELETSPGDFTPWFRMEWETLSREHAGLLERYTAPAR